MKHEYVKWINDYNQKYPDVCRMCDQATLEMRIVFPELKRIRGFVHHILSTKPSEHWWLKDTENNIIDPTAKQFVAIYEYEEWDEKRDEPTGKCLNCGDYCYYGQSTCSKTCAKEFVASLQHQNF